MAVTVTSICNMALRQIGEKRISDISDLTDPARILTDVYEPVRNEVLESHPWNFSIIRVALVVLAGTPAFGYTYQFQLPADCLRVIRMSETDIEFKIEQDRLLTNESSAKILYIKLVTDTSLYSATFVATLATRLAAEIAYPITNDQTLAVNKYKEYLEMLRVAKGVDAQGGGTTEKIEENTWLTSRG